MSDNARRRDSEGRADAIDIAAQVFRGHPILAAPESVVGALRALMTSRLEILQ